MNTETGLMAVSVGDEAGPRRGGVDRRESQDRRQGFSGRRRQRRGRRGLFEYRANREGEVTDRRQGDRRAVDNAGSWWSFWRRGA